MKFWSSSSKNFSVVYLRKRKSYIELEQTPEAPRNVLNTYMLKSFTDALVHLQMSYTWYTLYIQLAVYITRIFLDTLHTLPKTFT